MRRNEHPRDAEQAGAGAGVNGSAPPNGIKTKSRGSSPRSTEISLIWLAMFSFAVSTIAWAATSTASSGSAPSASPIAASAARGASGSRASPRK